MGTDDGEAPPAKDPPAKVFCVGNFGVDDEIVDESPLVLTCWRRRVIMVLPNVLTKVLLRRCLSKALLQRYFGGGDVGEVTEDGGEAPHAEELGKCGASIDAIGLAKPLVAKVSLQVVLVQTSKVSVKFLLAEGWRSHVKMHLS